LILLVVLLGTVGCVKSEITESDSSNVKKQFSQESYEEAMIKSGKEQELQEEKARWAAHEASGVSQGE